MSVNLQPHYLSAANDAMSNLLMAMSQQGRITPDVYQAIATEWQNKAYAFASDLQQRYPQNQLNSMTLNQEIKAYAESIANNYAAAIQQQRQQQMMRGPQFGGYQQSPWGMQNQQQSQFGGFGVQQQMAPGLFNAQQANTFGSTGLLNTNANMPGGNNPYQTTIPHPKVVPFKQVVDKKVPPNMRTEPVGGLITKNEEVESGWIQPSALEESTIKHIKTTEFEGKCVVFRDNNCGQNIDYINGELKVAFVNQYEAVRYATRLVSSSHTNKFLQIVFPKLAVYNAPREDVVKVMKEIKTALGKASLQAVDQLKAIKKVLNKATRGTSEFIESLILDDFNRYGTTGALRSEEEEEIDDYQLIVYEYDTLIDLIDPTTEHEGYKSMQANPKFIPKVETIITEGISKFLSNCHILDPKDPNDLFNIKKAMPEFSYSPESGGTYILNDLGTLLEESKALTPKTKEPTAKAVVAAAVITDMFIALQEYTIICRLAVVGYSTMFIPSMYLGDNVQYTGGVMIDADYESNLEFCIGDLSECNSPWPLYIEAQPHVLMEYVVSLCLTTNSKKSVRLHPSRMRSKN